MKLFIIHSHYRPGGVRRVIELAAPAVAAALRPRATEIVLVGGEAPEKAWLDYFRKGFHGVPVTCAIEPVLGYLSEQRADPRRIRRRIRSEFERWFADVSSTDCLIWAHNPGLGRNLMVGAELSRIARERALPMIFHHHDWWFDNRWARWPEMKRTGYRTLAAVAHAILPTPSSIRHAAINQADARILGRHFGARSGWVPNPAAREIAPQAAGVRGARSWLGEQLGDAGPVWLVPCRLLRRKNLMEALLLTRWLRPEAWLVTTGAMSSADEALYAGAVAREGRRRGWRLRLSVLAGTESGKPSVPELLAASETVLLTSLQEGFGLPSLEAAAAGRPLIARRLPAIAADLARFGFRFPQSYDEVEVDGRLFDVERERRRQSQRWQKWRSHLPRSYRMLAATPPLLAEGRVPISVPFSRLTLAAQFEVLLHPPEHSWKLCAPLNPFLPAWRSRAAAGTLIPSAWPRHASRWLSGPAYGRHIAKLLRAKPRGAMDPQAGERAADEFIRAKLSGENQYPLLWTNEP